MVMIDNVDRMNIWGPSKQMFTIKKVTIKFQRKGN